MTHKKKKRELFSFNSAIILFVTLILFAILKAVFAPPVSLLEEARPDLTEEAKIVLDKVTNGTTEVSLLNSDELIEEKVENMDSMDYEEVKSILGVNNDFCIFVEDISGGVVEINGMTTGIGSDKISINGNPCG